MVNEIDKIGLYVKATCCDECSWFSRPRKIGEDYYEVCPECGGEVSEVSGRYNVTVSKGFLGMFKKVKYVGFSKKSKEKINHIKQGLDNLSRIRGS